MSPRQRVRRPYVLPERFRDLDPERTPIHEADPATRARTDEEVLYAFDPLEAVYEAQRCLYCHEPRCVAACPIGQDCREYILEISRGNFGNAKGIILQDNPLASTLAHVCYHYCEADCVCGVSGEPIAIRHLKRAALDYGGPEVAYARGEARGQSVGIVGGGPAGLTAAWWLGQRGYDVTVYEGSNLLGGLATMTIPTYRLPREAFQQDVDRLRDLGIEFVMNVRLGRDVTLAGLRDAHDAVLVAVGTHAPQLVKLPGLDLPGAWDALDYLKGMFVTGEYRVGERVAVIGGGDVAMDCARMSLRRGAKEVSIVYRRSRGEMPASDEEIAETMAEGVQFRFLTAPLRVVGEGRVSGLECQRMELGDPDASGRRKPVPVPASNFVIPVDTVVLAIGQSADPKGLGLDDAGVTVDGEGVLVGLEGGPRTKLEDVFVAGGTSVVAAMKAGREAATAIERHLERQVTARAVTVSPAAKAAS